MQTLLRVQDTKDPKSHLSSYRAAKVASAISMRLNLESEFAQRIEVGIMLRDIGKIGVPDAILHKTGKLTESEMDVMRRHPDMGVEIIKPLLGDESVIIGVVKKHHERWDGTGYPNALKGNEIEIEARIAAVADSFIAMATPKSYRHALLLETVLQNLTAGSGSQFDPDVVAALSLVPSEILVEIHQQQLANL